MLTLTIDGREAVIKQGTSFKLTREHPAFSEQGDYTFEVTLPLAGCVQNLRIFGALHRPEAAMGSAKKDYPFTLFSPLVSLTGTARITSVSDTEVKVQLVAGQTAANLNSKDEHGNERYIDELELGLVGGYKEENVGLYPQERLYNHLTGSMQRKACLRWQQSPEVFFPIINTHHPTATDYGYTPINPCQVANNPSISSITNNLLSLYLDHQKGDYAQEYCTSKTGLKWQLAPQPYLYECLRRVLAAVGVTLDDSCTDDFIRSVAIANSRTTEKYTNILPHWTVSDFLKEFNAFFDTVIVYNADGTASVRKVTDLIGAGEEVALTEVSDEIQTSLDEEDTGSSGEGNADYEWPDEDKQLRVPDDVWEQALIDDFVNKAALERAWNTTGHDGQSRSLSLMREAETGGVFAALRPANDSRYRLHRVDFYGPRLTTTTTRDCGTTLRIVPCRMTHGDPALRDFFAPLNGLPVLVTTDPWMGEGGSFNVNDALNPATDEEDDTEEGTEKRDLIEVFLSNGQTCGHPAKDTGSMPDNMAALFPIPEQNIYYVPVPLGVEYQQRPDTGLLEPITSIYPRPMAESEAVKSFSLCSPNSLMSVGATSRLANTRVEHQFKIVARGELDLTRTYLIRGRRYVCHKLEYTLTADRCDPLVTGYFYELN